MTDELIYLIWLTVGASFSTGIGKRLLKYTPEQIYNADREELSEMGFSEKAVNSLTDKRLDRAERILKICSARGIIPVTCYSKDYPDCMKNKSDMPAVIYTRGDVSLMNGEKRVGFVGTRSTTPRGKAFAEHIANELGSMGATLITGSASGIDSVALTSAFNNKTSAVSVLGCDIDEYYPSENYALLEYIAENGLVISEYPPETNARYFHSRNRIIAALSHSVAVLEAPIGSGALITAGFASEYGVPVYAPYFHGDSFEGCRKIVESGGYDLICGADVFSVPVRENVEKMSIPKPRTVKKIVPKSVEAPAVSQTKTYGDPILEHVIECIRHGIDTPNGMVDNRHTIQEILSALTQLEIEGDVEALPGNRYSIK